MPILSQISSLTDSFNSFLIGDFVFLFTFNLHNLEKGRVELEVRLGPFVAACRRQPTHYVKLKSSYRKPLH